MRLVEIGLFLLPLVAWLLWLRIAAQQGPSPVLIAAMAAALLALGALLVWFSVREGAPPGAVYHPPHMENGHLVPGVATVR